MSRDRRWAGGRENRTWSRGSEPLGRVIDYARLTGDVRRYLADCRQFRALLSAANHPGADSCLKVIYHQGAEEKAFILGEFRRLTGVRLEAVHG